MSIESKIRDMNREILALKTEHPFVSDMITYYGTFTFAFMDEGNHVYEITYVQGEQPILTFDVTSFGSTGELLFGEPVGNVQLMYSFEEYETFEPLIALCSTRQIISVRPIA